MRFKKMVSMLLAASMCAGALSGCAGSSKGGSETTAQQETAGESSAAETKEKKTAGALKEGGDLKIAIPQFQKIFFMPQSTSTGDWFAAEPVLEQLGRSDEEGNYVPWLAEKFETDADNLTFTITLRDGVKFSDGSPCDAEAVAWNIQQYVDNGKASEVCNPKSIEVVDEKTVKITFDEWANNWDSAIGAVFISSKKAYDDNGEEWCKTHAIGTGPFIMDEFVTDNKVTYHKNPDYRITGQPYLDTLEIDMMSDVNTMMSAMLNKEVGVAMKFESDSIIKQLQDAGFTAIGRKTANVADIKHIIWNSKSDKHPMGDLKVRQAIMHAIPWDDVAGALSGGIGEATPLFATPDSWAYKEGTEFYDYDVELAKSALAEAGYPDGFETKIYCKAQDNDTATAFQAILSQINIKAEVVTMDASALAEMQKEDDIDGFIANRGASKMDFTANYIRLYSTEGIKNHGIMLDPPEFEEPLFAARAAKTLDEKKEKLQEAAVALAHDYVMITPLAVIYYQSFADPALADTGIYDVSLEQWTPEATHWTE